MQAVLFSMPEYVLQLAFLTFSQNPTENAIWPKNAFQLFYCHCSV